MTIAHTYEHLKQKVEKTTLVSDWIEDHITIDTPFELQTKFELRDYQVDILLNLELSKFNIFAKARQLGFTTLMFASAIHQSIYQPNYTTCVMVTQSSYNALSDILRAMVARGVAKSDVLSMSKEGIVFSNGSTIKLIRHSPSAMTGYNIDHLVLDECCFFNDLNLIMQAAVHQADRITMYSTPSHDSRVNKQFKKRYKDKNHWNSHKYTWTVHEEWDSEWAHHMQQNMGVDKFEVEFNCKFK